MTGAGGYGAVRNPSPEDARRALKHAANQVWLTRQEAL